MAAEGRRPGSARGSGCRGPAASRLHEAGPWTTCNLPRPVRPVYGPPRRRCHRQEDYMAPRWTTASAAAFGALLFAVSAAPAGAADVSVGPGESIQAAVDAASPGDTITVSGRHRENVVITKDRITLRGVRKGPDGAVLRPPKQPAEACALGGPNDISGFCVLGQGNLATGEIT